MTTPSSTPSEVEAAVAASPVLSPEPGRYAAGGYVDAPAVEDAEPVDESLPNVLAYRAEDGRVHYASPHSKTTHGHLATGTWVAVDPDELAFDPAGKRVRDVVTYLEEHADDEAEVDRVKAAEAAGENRPTIAAWSADPQ